MKNYHQAVFLKAVQLIVTGREDYCCHAIRAAFILVVKRIAGLSYYDVYDECISYFNRIYKPENEFQDDVVGSFWNADVVYLIDDDVCPRRQMTKQQIQAARIDALTHCANHFKNT